MAFRLDDTGWYRLAGERLLAALLIALLAGGLVYLANRLVLPQLWPDPIRSPKRLHWFVGGFIFVAGLVGSVMFAITRPYM